MDALPEGFVKSVYVAPRRHGKTRMMVDWARRNPDSIIIVMNPGQKTYLEKEYPDLKGRVIPGGTGTGLNYCLRGFGKVAVGVDDLDFDAITEDFVEAIKFATWGEGIDFATVIDHRAEDYLKVRKRKT